METRILVQKFPDLSQKDRSELQRLTKAVDSWFRRLLDGRLDESRTAYLDVARAWQQGLAEPIGWSTSHVTLVSKPKHGIAIPVIEYSVFVDPKHRGTGLGRQLIQALKEACVYPLLDLPRVAFPFDKSGEEFYRRCNVAPITAKNLEDGEWGLQTPLDIDRGEE